MEVTVKVSDEVVALAKARGMRVEEYIEEILAHRLENGGTASRPPRSSEEVKAWLDSLAQFSEKIPPLPKKITREWIYQEHE